MDNFNEIDVIGGGGERVAVYSEQGNIVNILKSIESNKIDKRYAFISESNGVKIANLHLSGGRFVDDEFEKIVKKNNNEKEINEFIKNRYHLLELVINENPDIILGDFNSVLSDNARLNKFLKEQYNYFRSKQLPLKNQSINKFIKAFNLEPYNLLKSKNYIYSKPENEESMITSIRGKSIVDTIWYRNENVELKNTNIIDYDSTQSGGKGKANKKIIYTGAFLNKKGIDALHKYFNSKLENKVNVIKNDPLHMTIYYNKDNKPNSELKSLSNHKNFKVGKNIKLKVLGYKETDKIQLVKVTDGKFNGHITLTIDKGAKPKEANDLIDDKKSHSLMPKIVLN